VAQPHLPPVPDRSPQITAGGRAVANQTESVNGAFREDYQLAQQLATGDAAAWRTLVARFQRLVLARTVATARELDRPLSQADAEDLCAEVFSQLIADNYSTLRRFEGRSTLSTWLCVVTRRIVLRRLWSSGRDPAHPAATAPRLEALAGPATEEPLATMISDEDRMLLAAGIAQLGERQQQLARMFYLEGQSYREISQKLNMPINSIGPTLARIHERLRAAMKHEEP